MHSGKVKSKLYFTSVLYKFTAFD